MKRLFSVTGILAVLIAALSVLDPGTALAAPSAPAVDAQAMIGMSVSELESKYGKAGRSEPSEFGFTWHVYNRDYKNYFMAGIKNGRVVAIYTTAATLRYGSSFQLSSTKSTVRSKLGEPISYLRSGNTVALLSDTDQRDFFPVDDNYVIVFYDILNGSKVTSVMIVPQDDEVRTVTSKQALTAALLEAYQRISIDLVNAARARNGLKTLAVDALSTNLAISRSKDMVKRDYFGHYTPENKSPMDLAKEMGFKYTSFGENIAYGNNNAMLAHESFMNSSGHRNNVLKSAYTKIGAGAAYGGSRYVILTNIFSNNTANPPATSTPPPASSPDAVKRHDVNGDGIISVSDYTLIRLSILGIKPLTGDAKTAADVNGDGIISVADYTLVRLDILGIKKIG
jgi:uncharacterized protein YkwD